MILLSTMLDAAEELGQKDALEGIERTTTAGILEALDLDVDHEELVAKGSHILIRNAYEDSHERWSMGMGRS